MTSKNTNKSFINLTGRYSYESSRGNQCLFVLHNYDSTYFDSYPLKSSQAAGIKKAYKLSYTNSKKIFTNHLYILNNACSNNQSNNIKE